MTGKWTLPSVLALFGLLFPPGPAAAGEGSDLPGVLLSRQLVEAEGLEVGDVVTLSPNSSDAFAREFRVAGSYEPIPDPMRITDSRFEARLHLPDLLELTRDRDGAAGDGSVGSINVALRDPSDAGAFSRDLSARVPFLLSRPTVDDDGSNPFVVLKRFHLGIALITVIGSTAFLLALMMMRAEERRETAGILRLIGFTRRRVMLEVFAEGLLVSIAGALFGVVLSAACEDLFNRFFQWRYDTQLIFLRLTPSIAWRCVALAVPLGVLAGLVASWTLLRREILALLRR